MQHQRTKGETDSVEFHQFVDSVEVVALLAVEEEGLPCVLANIFNRIGSNGARHWFD